MLVWGEGPLILPLERRWEWHAREQWDSRWTLQTLGCARGLSKRGPGQICQPREMVQTFLIFLMSLSSSLGVTVWVDWMRSLSLSRDAICNGNTGQLQGPSGTSWWKPHPSGCHQAWCGE